jgi:hypothetical protein
MQQVMEPSAIHQGQKHTEKGTHHKQMTINQCFTTMKRALTFKTRQNRNEMRVNEASQWHDKCWQVTMQNFKGHLQGVGKSCK